MRQTFTMLACFLFICQNSFGQIAPESIAPDFTATDIYGQEHNLYDLLDEGKVVVLDVFATWCPPCWSYHEAHHLKDVFEKYGPDGTDEMYVFSIEGDAGTNIDCIYGPSGCNSSTTGDWTLGTPYPIIDSREIALDYQINYFPTIFMVYPNRLVSEIGQLNEAAIVELKDLAPTITEGLNPVIIKDDAFNGSVCSNLHQHVPYYLISNYGEETITSAKIDLFKNGKQIYTKEWVGEAGSYAIIDEIRANSNLLRDNTTFEVRLSNINGDASQTRSFFDQVTFETTSTLYVTVETDENSAADANHYKIFNEAGTLIIYENINEANAFYENKHIITRAECYEFKIYDAAGNGIDGNITVRDDEGNMIYQNDGFEFEDFNSFNITTLTSNQDILENVSFNLAPNPASEFVNLAVELENQGIFQISITSITGQVILNKNNNNFVAGLNTVDLDVSSLSNGVYFIKIENETGMMTQRLVIQN